MLRESMGEEETWGGCAAEQEMLVLSEGNSSLARDGKRRKGKNVFIKVRG